LPAGIALELRTIRADDGSPVSPSRIRLLALTNRREALPDSFDGAATGTSVIAGIPSGEYLVHVEPSRTSDLSATRSEAIAFDDSRPRQSMTLRLPRATERLLRVFDASRTPIPGSRVQLLEHAGGPPATV